MPRCLGDEVARKVADPRTASQVKTTLASVDLEAKTSRLSPVSGPGGGSAGYPTLFGEGRWHTAGPSRAHGEAR